MASASLWAGGRTHRGASSPGRQTLDPACQLREAGPGPGPTSPRKPSEGLVVSSDGGLVALLCGVAGDFNLEKPLVPLGSSWSPVSGTSVLRKGFCTDPAFAPHPGQPPRPAPRVPTRPVSVSQVQLLAGTSEAPGLSVWREEPWRAGPVCRGSWPTASVPRGPPWPRPSGPGPPRFPFAEP